MKSVNVTSVERHVAPAPGGLRKVLVVEDSEFVHQIYRVAFRKLGGFDVLHANDGREGLLRLAETGPVDLIILDINMPVMDGLSFLTELRSRPAHSATHVLVVSTESEQGKLREALKRGAQSFLQKPFTLEQLLGLLDRVVPLVTGKSHG